MSVLGDGPCEQSLSVPLSTGIGPRLQPGRVHQGGNTCNQSRTALTTRAEWASRPRSNRPIHKNMTTKTENRSGTLDTPVTAASASFLHQAQTVQLARLADELTLAHREIAETVSLLETLQAAAPVGLGFVDRQFRTVRCNDALASISGAPKDELLGRTVAEAVPQLWPKLESVFRLVLDTGADVVNLDVSGESAQDPGRTHYWLASYYPVRLAEEIIGVGIVVVDVTERREAQQAHDELLRSAIAAIAATIEARDPYTAGHEHRVAEIARVIATEMGLDDDTVDGIELAATIHDIGKIAVPSDILSRPGPLHPAEFELVKTHSRAGHDIVAGIVFPWPIAEMILQHHERLNGTGYPDGLRGEEILIGARIIAVADVLEAMGSHRPYRPSLGVYRALEEIDKGRGTIFDPDVADVCLRLFGEGRLPIEDQTQPA